ncbi:MAG TPA: hypothetical protein VIO11_06835 [Candidatus Methanoperedens sp.]
MVSGAHSQFKGTGVINGSGNYEFLLTATDGAISGGGDIDQFRIKIWDKTTGNVVYDNVFGASDNIDSANPQAIGGEYCRYLELSDSENLFIMKVSEP